MKKHLVILMLLTLSIPLAASIIESNTLTAVLDYIDAPNTLVIFDIDNTIARPIQELSSDEWFCHLVDSRMAQGHDYITSIYYALPAAFYAQFNIPLTPTEHGIKELLANLSNKGIAVMALSTRSLFIAERTLEQLDNIGIEFYAPQFDPSDLVLPMLHPCFYKHGILFGGNNDKGQALMCLFNLMNYRPETVIFIDDKMKYVVSVESALEQEGINYYGIRYSGCDDRVKNFDPEKAQAQYRELIQKNRNLANY